MFSSIRRCTVALTGVLLCQFGLSFPVQAEDVVPPPPRPREGPRYLASAPNLEVEGVNAVRRWRDFVFTRWMQLRPGDFAEFEKICDDAITLKTQAIDGSAVVLLFSAGFDEMFMDRRAVQDWVSDLSAFTEWKAAYPKSSCAPLIEAKWWHAHGWAARGREFGKPVAKEAQELFAERSRKAFDLAQNAAALRVNNPYWYEVVADAALDSGQPTKQILGLVAEGLKTHPNSWRPSLLVAVRMAPKWGGSWKQVDSYINTVAKLKEGKEADEFYAWHYAFVMRNAYLYVNAEMPHFDWPRVRAGFTAMRARLPDSNIVLNHYAAMACLAEDAETYAAQRRIITTGRNRYDGQAWEKFRVSLDICNRRFKLDTPL